MNEVEKTEGGMGVLKAGALLAGTAIGGIWLLSAAGIIGTAVVGALAVAGTAAYGAYTDEGPFTKVKSVFSKLTSMYSEAVSSVKAGFSVAKDWAEKHEAERRVDSGTAPVATKESAPDFAKAANANAPEVEKKPAPAPAPAPQRKLGA